MIIVNNRLLSSFCIILPLHFSTCTLPARSKAANIHILTLTQIEELVIDSFSEQTKVAVVITLLVELKDRSRLVALLTNFLSNLSGSRSEGSHILFSLSGNISMGLLCSFVFFCCEDASGGFA